MSTSILTSSQQSAIRNLSRKGEDLENTPLSILRSSLLRRTGAKATARQAKN